MSTADVISRRTAIEVTTGKKKVNFVRSPAGMEYTWCSLLPGHSQWVIDGFGKPVNVRHHNDSKSGKQDSKENALSTNKQSSFPQGGAAAARCSPPDPHGLEEEISVGPICVGQMYFKSYRNNCYQKLFQLWRRTWVSPFSCDCLGPHRLCWFSA